MTNKTETRIILGLIALVGSLVSYIFLASLARTENANAKLEIQTAKNTSDIASINTKLDVLIERTDWLNKFANTSAASKK